MPSRLYCSRGTAVLVLLVVDPVHVHVVAAARVAGERHVVRCVPVGAAGLDLAGAGEQGHHRGQAAVDHRQLAHLLLADRARHDRLGDLDQRRGRGDRQRLLQRRDSHLQVYADRRGGDDVGASQRRVEAPQFGPDLVGSGNQRGNRVGADARGDGLAGGPGLRVGGDDGDAGQRELILVHHVAGDGPSGLREQWAAREDEQRQREAGGTKRSPHVPSLATTRFGVTAEPRKIPGLPGLPPPQTTCPAVYAPSGGYRFPDADGCRRGEDIERGRPDSAGRRWGRAGGPHRLGRGRPYRPNE